MLHVLPTGVLSSSEAIKRVSSLHEQYIILRYHDKTLISGTFTATAAVVPAGVSTSLPLSTDFPQYYWQPLLCQQWLYRKHSTGTATAAAAGWSAGTAAAAAPPALQWPAGTATATAAAATAAGWAAAAASAAAGN